MSQISDFFSKTGPLSQIITGYSPRKIQIDMALAVKNNIENIDELVIEAGTGIGKTFAYLVPSLLSDKKIIISTGSKALQEQLYHRDLPNVLKALKIGKKTALLKGRSNYLCSNRLEQHVAQVPTDDTDVMHQLAMVAKFASETKTGDLADCIGIEEDAKVLPYVTSTTDNCLGADCPDFESCFIKKARQKAVDSELIIINHHLFFADMAVKESGFAEIMPDAQAYIFDEAHQLPEIASNYFGQTFSTKALFAMIKDLYVIYRAELFDMIQLGKSLEKLQSSVSDFRLQFSNESSRGDWPGVLKQTHVKHAFERVNNDIAFLYQVIKLALERTDKIQKSADLCVKFKALIEAISHSQGKGQSIWFETSRFHVSINVTPLNISDKFSELIKTSGASWCFTSATLSVNENLDHFCQSMGVNPEQQLIYLSPFDYYNQSVLCLPRYLPEVNSHESAHALVKIAKKLVNAAKGRTFILFTSYRMMRLVAEGLNGTIDYPILIQGQTSKRILLEKFIHHGNSVLLGTASFWEGVDVRGKALSCVIIDKIPFTAPDDPLLQAKMKECAQNGGDPFYDIQIPQAVISLKQGVGRLIRDVKDKGVLVICDNRLVTRQYGEIFLSSLPVMNRTRNLDNAVEFLTKIDEI